MWITECPGCGATIKRATKPRRGYNDERCPSEDCGHCVVIPGSRYVEEPRYEYRCGRGGIERRSIGEWEAVPDNEQAKWPDLLEQDGSEGDGQ